MNILMKRLFRIIWATKGQFLAMAAVVTIGISVYISITTSFNNLSNSQQFFYEENNFADYYFQVVKAPETIIRQIESLPGVSQATGRIQQDVPIVKSDNSRATARLTSYPLPLDDEINRIQLLNGRFFDENPLSGELEVMLDPQYFAANHLTVSDQIKIIAEGKQIPVTIVGTATGPEFIYAIKDAASLIPQPETFAILMIPTEQAQEILNLNGQINQVIVKFSPGANEEKISDNIEEILEPYGNLASFPRKHQLSHAALQAELDGLLTTSRFLPVLFLIVAAAIQFVLLRRMVKSQRLQIGILKALGYGNRQLILHFTGYALAISILGATLGILLGLVFASAISDIYTQFFNLPAAIGKINLKAIIYSILLSLSVGSAAGFTATRAIVEINPAESMRPKPPAISRRSLLEKWHWLWKQLNTSWRMSLRSISRNRVRSLITSFGVTIAVALLVVSLFMNDSVDYMLNQHFNREIHYDFLLRFTSPVSDTEIFNLLHIDGVNRVEPLLEIPVKVNFNNKSESEIILGLDPGSNLQVPMGENGQRLSIPETGILLSEKTARKLNIRPGDTITVETRMIQGKSYKKALKIIGINRQLMGGNSFVSLKQANRLLNEARLINGAMLQVNTGKMSTVEQKLNDKAGIASIVSRQNERDNIMSMLDSLIYFVGIMITFAVILGFAIIYNSSVLSFNERRREFASLRAIGFFEREVSDLLFKETMIQSSPGIILGLPVGYIMAHSYVSSVNTDLYSMPVVVFPLTYFLAAGGGIAFVLIGHWFALRGLKSLTPAEVLKSVD